ncbi:mariner Mos1 transposase [Trichonephila clavipes]|nr:mariner Mos1 transposase [Trichonephila clavipes]
MSILKLRYETTFELQPSETSPLYKVNETHEKLKEVYKDEVITSKSVYVGFKRFRRRLKKTKVRREKLRIKTMLIAFIDSKGLIHKKFFAESTYAEVLKRLPQRIRRVDPEYAMQAPADFFLFTKLKSALKGKRFTDITDIQSNVTAELKAIPKELFYSRLHGLYTRPQQCITIHGIYFEGRTVMAGSDVVQSGSPVFDYFFQHLWPYISNNTANVVFQMVKRLWLIRIDQ